MNIIVEKVMDKKKLYEVSYSNKHSRIFEIPFNSKFQYYNHYSMFIF